MSSLNRDSAHELVPEITSEVSTRKSTRERAVSIAKQTEYEYPVNRASKIIAAAAVYIASYETQEYLTQQEIATAAPTGTNSIRDCYRDILKYYDADKIGSLAETRKE